jgi:hypothetical protein
MYDYLTIQLFNNFKIIYKKLFYYFIIYYPLESEKEKRATEESSL